MRLAANQRPSCLILQLRDKILGIGGAERSAAMEHLPASTFELSSFLTHLGNQPYFGA